MEKEKRTNPELKNNKIETISDAINYLNLFFDKMPELMEEHEIDMIRSTRNSSGGVDTTFYRSVKKDNGGTGI